MKKQPVVPPDILRVEIARALRECEDAAEADRLIRILEEATRPVERESVEALAPLPEDTPAEIEVGLRVQLMNEVEDRLAEGRRYRWSARIDPLARTGYYRMLVECEPVADRRRELHRPAIEKIRAAVAACFPDRADDLAGAAELALDRWFPVRRAPKLTGAMERRALLASFERIVGSLEDPGIPHYKWHFDLRAPGGKMHLTALAIPEPGR